MTEEAVLGELSAAEKNMQAAGVNPTDSGYTDYFGFDERRKFYMPDGKQYIEYKLMTEGDRAQYQKLTSKPVRLFKTTGDAQVNLDAGQERAILLNISTTGWFMFRGGEQVTYNSKAFEKWMEGADPAIISDYETEIRKANTWMTEQFTVADIDKEIENLQELRRQAVEREEGK
jgi:hypothetical protein